ncbi:hypothetical protein [Streptomyces asiaticus]
MGAGQHCYFNVDPGVVAARAFEVPDTLASYTASRQTYSNG